MNWLLFIAFLLKGEFLFTFASDILEKSQLEQYEGVKYATFTKANRSASVDIRHVNFNDDYTNVFVVHGFESKNIDKALKAKNDIFKFDVNVGRVIIISWLNYSHASGKLLRLFMFLLNDSSNYLCEIQIQYITDF